MTTKILLKISGEALSPEAFPRLDALLSEIKNFDASHYWSIVIGGGNFFRGNTHGSKLGITLPTAHNVGMLATVMNGLIISDLCTQKELSVTHLSAFDCQALGDFASQKNIASAIKDKKNIIFSGGVNVPFFSTDTTAVIRALQIGAKEVWKLTKVDGIYDCDPLKNPTAKKYTHISYQEFIEKKLAILDTAAVALARQNNLIIRVLPMNHTSVIEAAFTNPQFGSILGGEQ